MKRLNGAGPSPGGGDLDALLNELRLVNKALLDLEEERLILEARKARIQDDIRESQALRDDAQIKRQDEQLRKWREANR